MNVIQIPHHHSPPRSPEPPTITCAFQNFLALGPGRKLKDLAGQYRAKGKKRPSYDTLRHWSSAHDWTQRAADWDREDLQRREIELRAVARRTAIEALERRMGLANLLLEKGEEGLRSMPIGQMNPRQINAYR